jgi:hypothetical protein
MSSAQDPGSEFRKNRTPESREMKVIPHIARKEQREIADLSLLVLLEE